MRLAREGRVAVLAAATVIGLGAAWPGRAADNLSEALANAYLNNPDLGVLRAELRGTDEGVPQALGGWRPTVEIDAQGGYKRTDGSRSDAQKLRQANGTLSVVQPLYRGGRTIASTAQAENEVLANRSRLRSAEQAVLLAAVIAYMDILRDRARVELNLNNEQVLQRQLEATRDRFDVGEVTRTDVAQAEARLARAVAERISAEGSLAVADATYERVIGTKPGDLEAAPPLPELPASLKNAAAVTLAENPDLEGAGHSQNSAREAVRVAFGEILPNATLNASLSGGHETSIEDSNTHSVSLLARVTVPIYQAGAVHARVRQAKELRNQRRIEVERARRRAIETVSQSWENLSTARSNIAARQQEVRANGIALEGVRQEAAVGSRTTLDVLDAEQELLDARVSLVEAERTEYIAGFTLYSAIGRLSVAHLNVPVTPYDPTVHYNQVRDKYWGWEISE